MSDEPITIKGGSLKIETNKKLSEKTVTGGKYNYDHPDSGQITSVEVDGTSYPASQNSVIVIHYDVP